MSLLSALLRRSERHSVFSSLIKLDDHLLRDIGLTRTDLALMRNGRRPRPRPPAPMNSPKRLSTGPS